MKTKKNNQRKGFSLIELLGVIVILGIISTVTIVSIKYLKTKSKENHYESQISNLLSTGKIFVGDNESKLPKNIGQKTTITLEELVNNNYIKQIKDYEKENCYNDKSYVNIYKYAKDKYSYYAYLSCPNYESTKNSSYNDGPIITITPHEEDQKVEFKVEARTVTSLGYSTTNKLLSYKYILYMNMKEQETDPDKFIEITNSGDIEAGLIEKITKDIKLSGPIPSEYKLEVTAVDIYGNVSTRTKKFKTEDNTPPTCGTITNAATGPDDWAPERLVTVECVDNESGCEKDEYTKLFNENATDGEIIIKDKAGKERACSFKINIDNTPPTCSIGLNGKQGKNGWYKERAVELNLTKNDAGGSGIAEYGLDPSPEIYNSKTTGTQSNTDATGVIWYGVVRDKAGNKTVCATPRFTVDKDKPTCNVSGGSSSWINATSTEGYREIKATCDDGISGSGCTILTFSKFYDENIDTNKAGAKGVNDGGSFEDYAGNITNCSANKTVRIDKSPPTCSISLNGTQGKPGWYKASNVTVTLNKTDTGGSGLSTTEYGLAANTKNYNSKTVGTQSNTLGVVWYGVTKDQAGNEGVCYTTEFKVDKDPPRCDVTGGNSTWINKNSTPQKRTITATCVDTGGSNCVISSFSKEYSENINTTKAGANGNNSGGSVEDNAGNKTSCAANQTVKIDKNPPTCTVTGGGDSWISSKTEKQSRTVKAKCSDTGGSNCKTEDFSKKYSSDIETTKAGAKGVNNGGSVEDNAGNKTNCPANRTVKIDKTPPTFDSKLHYCEPNETNQFYPFGYTVSDNLSKINKSTEKFYYCYDVNSGWPSGCGTTCKNGWGTATFTKKDDMIISAVSIGCSTHSKTNFVGAKFEVCDNAGNCNTKGSDSNPIKYNWHTHCDF